MTDTKPVTIKGPSYTTPGDTALLQAPRRRTSGGGASGTGGDRSQVSAAASRRSPQVIVGVVRLLVVEIDPEGQDLVP